MNSEKSISPLFIVLSTALVVSIATAGIIFSTLPPSTTEKVKVADTKSNVEQTIPKDTELQDLTFQSVQEGRQTFHSNNYAYQLVKLDKANDQLLLRKDLKTAKDEVILKSIKEAFPELKGYLFTFLITTEKDEAILQTYLPDSDAPPGGFYKLDLKTLKLSEMNVNKVYSGLDRVIFPDYKSMAVLVSHDNPQKMYFLDLENDSYKELVTLKGDETFSEGDVGFGVITDIHWVNSEIVRYAVFNKKMINESTYENFNKALIEYREVKISR